MNNRYCQCTPDETTGWIEERLCNICGKIAKDAYDDEEKICMRYIASDKSTIYEIKLLLESSLEYASECLANHESNLGRSTVKNEMAALGIERDMAALKYQIKLLESILQNPF